MARSERSVAKEAFWRAQLDQQRQSGLNVRAFCRARSISEPSFYAWRRSLQDRDAEASAARDAPSGDGRERIASRPRPARTAARNRQGGQRLIPVNIVAPQREPVSSLAIAEHQRLEIVTPGGFTLRFAADASSDTLARVLNIMACCTAKGTSAC
jgi:hypothetical protein